VTNRVRNFQFVSAIAYLSFLFSCFAVTAVAQGKPLAPGNLRVGNFSQAPIAHWKFDEVSGNGLVESTSFVGTSALVLPATRVAGHIGKGAISFGTSSGYANLAAGSIVGNPIEGRDALTISLWVKFDRAEAATPHGDSLIENYANSSAWTIGLSRNPQEGVSFALRTGNGSATADSSGDLLAETERWHHLVGVYDGSKLMTYVDGRLSGTQPALSGVTTDTWPNLVLPTDSAGDKPYSFDDVRIYDKALTPDAVVSLFMDGGGVPSHLMPIIDSPVSARTGIGLPFTYQISSSNNPTEFSANQLPAGLSINTTTGVISGAPTVAGTFTVKIGVVSAYGKDTKDIVFNVEDIVATTLTRTVGDVEFTWEFNCSNRPCRWGRFVNGDFWVVPVNDLDVNTGSVTITRISPDGVENGAQINPYPGRTQGVLRGWQSYNDALNIMSRLPYTAFAGESIFKAATRLNGCRTTSNGAVVPCMASGDVLTVLAQVPPQNGATVFRPPFQGTWKPLFTTDKVKLERLSSISTLASSSPSAFASTVSEIVRVWTVPYFEVLTLDDFYRDMMPANVLPQYGADMAGRYNGGVGAMQGPESAVAKSSAVYALIQPGIDKFAIFKMGLPFGSGAGQRLGRKPPISFFAAMYDDEALLNEVRTIATDPKYDGFFQEDSQIKRTKSGVPVWGGGLNHGGQVHLYWSTLFSKWRYDVRGLEQFAGKNNQGVEELYGYMEFQSPYQSRSNAAHTSYAFNQLLMPWYRYAAGDPEIIEYTDRITNGRGIPGFSGGFWALPDECAPPDSREADECRPVDKPNNCLYYGVTWGPDSNNPGMCIKHKKDPNTYGRLPWLHGIPVSSFPPSSMTRWLAMRDCLDPVHTSYGTGVCSGIGPDPVHSLK
jgi:hypothetical protein